MAKDTGMDVFRVFDSVNYIENMRLGIDCVGEAGGIIEAAVCYTGDVSNPNRGQYDLEYYLNFVRELEALGINVLAIKDMAGLLKPEVSLQIEKFLAVTCALVTNYFSTPGCNNARRCYSPRIPQLANPRPHS